jgi:hypothetical protein
MKTKLASLIVGLLAGFGVACHGQTLEVQFLGVNPSLIVSGSFNSGTSYNGYSSGVSNFNLGSAFCVDPYQTIHNGEWIIYTLQDPNTLTSVGAVSHIVGGYYASAQTPLDAAGAQWAIWEAVVDGTNSTSFSSGQVRLQNPNSSVATRALDYLNNWSTLPAANLIYAVSPTRQDMVALGSPVPEPASALLAAAGLATLTIRRRR